MLYNSTAEWLVDGQYLPFVRASLTAACDRVYVMQFLIDPRPEEDVHGEVRYLLHALAQTARRGVDVRMLLAEVNVDRPLPVDLNEPAARFLIRRGVAVRRQAARSGVQMHAKAFVVDSDIIIAGGHNWTPGAFGPNVEASLVLRSEGCVAQVAARFEGLWSDAEVWP